MTSAKQRGRENRTEKSVVHKEGKKEEKAEIINHKQTKSPQNF